MLKAKPTIYKNYRFASRLEARWAYFLDAMSIPWEYEGAAFDLGEALTYLPDFWLPWHMAWLEIKGDVVNDEVGVETIRKCTRLAALSNYPVILTYRDPLDPTCIVFGVKGGMYTDAALDLCPVCCRFGVRAGERFLCPRRDDHTGVPLTVQARRSFRRHLFDAATAARQRRFAFERKPV